MENATEALKLVFAIFIFMVACVVLFNTASLAMGVTSNIISNGDKSKYYTYLDTSQQNIDANGNKIVTLEDIVPVLYRYSIESYAVTIIDNNEIVARFDTTTEGVCENWGRLTNSSKEGLVREINKFVLEPVRARTLGSVNDLQALFQRIYRQQPTGYYTRTFACPWTGKDALIAQRIDSDLSRSNCIF